MHAELRAHPWLGRTWECPLSRSRPTCARPRLGACTTLVQPLRREEDETRTPLQKAINDADYEHGHRVNELDFLTAFRSPVMVARKSNCAFNTSNGCHVCGS